MSQTVVAVAAHADDAELNAGGTLAKRAGQGDRVHILMVTNNASGFLIPEDGDETRKRRLGPVVTQAVRHAEQELAARQIGATVHYLNYPQRHYWDETLGRAVSIGFQMPHGVPRVLVDLPPLIIAFQQAEHIERMARLLIGLRPNEVMTQTPIDLDPEHHAVASMVWSAFQMHADDLRNVSLRFWTPGSSATGGLFDPAYDHIEDISDWFDRKLELCAAHRSQMTRFRWEMVKSRAAEWGRRLGVRYAEPFKTACFDPSGQVRAS